MIGFYGSGNYSSKILSVDNHDGTSWYCVEGSSNINLCLTQHLKEDIETIIDIDTMSSQDPIDTIDELIRFISSDNE